MSPIRHLLLGVATAVALAVTPMQQARADDLQLMQRFIDLMQGYFAIIESTYEVSAAPEKSAILQMQKIKEIMDERGQAAQAAEVFRDVLKNSRNPAIRSAAYVLLSETLKETGRGEEATNVLIEGLNESIALAQP